LDENILDENNFEDSNLSLGLFEGLGEGKDSAGS